MLTNAAVIIIIEALCHRPEGRGSNPDEIIRLSLIYIILPTALGLAVDSVTNRNEYQESSLGGGWGGEARLELKADENLTAICEPTV
jgi:hypothetical protein